MCSIAGTVRIFSEGLVVVSILSGIVSIVR